MSLPRRARSLSLPSFHLSLAISQLAPLTAVCLPAVVPVEIGRCSACPQRVDVANVLANTHCEFQSSRERHTMLGIRNSRQGPPERQGEDEARAVGPCRVNLGASRALAL